MADEVQDKRSIASYFTKKVVVSLSAVATVLTIVAGIWAFEAHYATNKRVDKVEIRTVQEVIELEQKIANALENQQYKGDIRYFQFMLDKNRNDIYDIKKQMQTFPDDPILKKDYEDLLERRKDIKDKLDETVNKIKVN
jgi:tRNA U34 5-carboxymethylaminomethyl modifying GTPase MnmE/TrmE